jgi:hypothetical protein
MMLGAALIVSTSAFAASGVTQATSSSAKPAAKAAPVATKVAEGTIKSASDNQLVIEHKAHGKMEDMTFRLEPSTQKTGVLDTGAKATVRYRTEGSDYVATQVTAHAAKKETKKPASY